MKANVLSFAAAAILIGGLAIAGCKKETAEPASASETPASSDGGQAAGGTGDTTGSGGTAPSSGGSGGSGTSIPTLVSVNLQNVLNNLSVELNVNRNNIPVTAQVPIDVAASVCGVSVSALAASVASGTASCTATTTSAQLTQLVQQQIASGGSVEGGDQTIGNTTSNEM
jgi:hypothetical protein